MRFPKRKKYLHFVNIRPSIFCYDTRQKPKGGLLYGKICSLREAFQKGKAQAGSGKAADLGRTEPRHQKAGKQQILQQKQSPELEA
jgi:hypothetical protein